MHQRTIHFIDALRIAGLAALLALVPVAGFAQSATAESYEPGRTPDGQPDLQGIWSNAVITPLERPAELADKEFLTEEEAIEYLSLIHI